MSTTEAIKKQQQRIYRLERTLSHEKLKARKADTRRKIEFGGLVIKAKMNKFTKDVILGALLDVAERLKEEPDIKIYYQSKGHAAFMGHHGG